MFLKSFMIRVSNELFSQSWTVGPNDDSTTLFVRIPTLPSLASVTKLKLLNVQKRATAR